MQPTCVPQGISHPEVANQVAVAVLMQTMVVLAVVVGGALVVDGMADGWPSWLITCAEVRL